MKQNIKPILQNSFYQLLIIYTLIILAISLNLFWKYSLQMSIFALIIATIGLTILISPKNKKTNKMPFYLEYIIPIISIIFIILIRIIPYLKNSIPLGYDAGIYKYLIENGLFNLDNWVLTSEPGLLYLTKLLLIIFSTQSILTYGLIAFCLLLGFAIYLTTKEYFNKQTALIALLIYSISSIQFLTFSYMYYKNIIALSLALFAIYFLKKEKTHYFILFAVLTGAMHRPTFYIFGLSYFIYAFTSPYSNKSYNFQILKSNILHGISILIITSLFYLGKFSPAITTMFNPVLQSFTQPGEASGTFITFFQYQYSILAYLPFALLGFFYLAKTKKFNMLFFWTLITLLIVYFQFFFFNRFIIHLDLMLLILASAGFSILIQNKKKLGTIILITLILSSGFVTYNLAKDTQPLITESELQTIQHLQTTEPNSWAMSTSSIYSPWILGYSNRKTIAPGLFDYNQHNKQEWQTFWTTKDINQIKSFLNQYQKPLYLFIGQKQKDNLAQFPECFTITHQNSNNKIYKYIC